MKVSLDATSPRTRINCQSHKLYTLELQIKLAKNQQSIMINTPDFTHHVVLPVLSNCSQRLGSILLIARCANFNSSAQISLRFGIVPKQVHWNTVVRTVDCSFALDRQALGQVVQTNLLLVVFLRRLESEETTKWKKRALLNLKFGFLYFALKIIVLSAYFYSKI